MKIDELRERERGGGGTTWNLKKGAIFCLRKLIRERPRKRSLYLDASEMI